MLRKFIFFSLVVFAFSHAVAAQETPGSRSVERRMNSLVIDALLRMEETSEIVDRQSGREFILNFESELTPVFCDLFSSGDFLQQIPVRQYVDCFLNADGVSRFTMATLEFRNVRKSGWSFENGRWYCTVLLEKSVNYFDENFVSFPLPGQNSEQTGFDISVKFVFDESCTGCRIAEINCSNAGDFEALPPHYLVVQKNEAADDAKRDENIMIGKSIAYRADSIVKSLREKKPFGYPVWYGITTAQEDENLFYILSGLEIRHEFYLDSDIKLLGLAGSREEVGEIVLNLVQEGYNKGELFNMKQYLQTR